MNGETVTDLTNLETLMNLFLSQDNQVSLRSVLNMQLADAVHYDLSNSSDLVVDFERCTRTSHVDRPTTRQSHDCQKYYRGTENGRT